MSYENHVWLDIPSSNRAISAALQFQLSQTATWSEGDLLNAQLGALTGLLNHATENCAYYKSHEYLSRVKPIRSKGIDSWRELPILERRTVQMNTPSLGSSCDLTRAHGNLHLIRSSGSTGRPVQIQSTDRAQLWWRVNTLRDHLWHKRDFAGVLAVIKHHTSGECMSPGRTSTSWGPATSSLYNTGVCHSLNSSESLHRQYLWLREKQPDFLITYPSLLTALARLNQESASALQFKNISTIGEILSEETREIAETSFNCRVTDVYSAQETGYLALQCPKHDHYHVQSESVFLEVLDNDGRPCKPGNIGKVVVTPLHNFATPLIRYEIGDYAIPGEPCDCGIRLPVLKKIIGRQRNLVTYPNGSKNWPSYNPMKLMDVLPVSQFQLRQTSRESMTLIVETSRKALTISQLREVQKIIIDAMGADFNIDVKCVEDIPRSHTGKYEEFVSELVD